MTLKTKLVFMLVNRFLAAWMAPSLLRSVDSIPTPSPISSNAGSNASLQ
jgi:hypothetical protein